MNAVDRIEPKFLRPTQLGWLRRKELDTRNGEVWEKPNGDLYIHQKSQGSLVLQFLRWPAVTT